MGFLRRNGVTYGRKAIHEVRQSGISAWHHTVVHKLSVSATADQTCITQDLEVMRDRRLAEIEVLGELTDANFAAAAVNHLDHP